GQAFLAGNNAALALEAVTPADILGLKDGRMRYALLLNDQGGIKDDFMAARLEGGPALYLVVNAATKESDFAYIAERTKQMAALAPARSRALLALQGPKAEAVLSRHARGVEGLRFMCLARLTVAGSPAIVSRSGYTGEDGYEISLDGRDAEAVA